MEKQQNVGDHIDIRIELKFTEIICPMWEGASDSGDKREGVDLYLPRISLLIWLLGIRALKIREKKSRLTDDS